MTRYSTKHKQPPKKNLFPLWLALAGLGLLLVAGWAVWSANSGQAKVNVEVKGNPRLKIEQELIDHGNVKLGTPIRDDIRVTNIGDQPLRFAEAPYIELKEGC